MTADHKFHNEENKSRLQHRGVNQTRNYMEIVSVCEDLCCNHDQSTPYRSRPTEFRNPQSVE